MSQNPPKNLNPLPGSGYVRLKQIIGSPKTGIPPIIPISKSTLWAWVKAGKFPKPVKLGPRVTAWPVDSIRHLVEQGQDEHKGPNSWR
jgi:predicted DNA-binding transcriptional regulator AlpA